MVDRSFGFETAVQECTRAIRSALVVVMAGQMVKCGVSVIRISGSNAFDAVKRMTSEHSAFPEFRKAVVRNILDVDTKEGISLPGLEADVCDWERRAR